MPEYPPYVQSYTSKEHLVNEFQLWMWPVSPQSSSGVFGHGFHLPDSLGDTEPRSVSGGLSCVSRAKFFDSPGVAASIEALEPQTEAHCSGGNDIFRSEDGNQSTGRFGLPSSQGFKDRFSRFVSGGHVVSR